MPGIKKITERRSRKSRPDLEGLENRIVLSSPYTPAFKSAIRSLMQQNDLPQISIAITKKETTYNYTFTNRNYTGFTGGSIPKISPSSVFRVGSVSKIFAAAVIMKEVQLGLLSLSDRSFQLLGYFDSSGNPISHGGTDPVTGQSVTYTPSSQLDQVTIQSLLNMSSGLPLSVPVASQTFPNAPADQVIYVPGSYAALEFSGAPPYSQPATVNQQIAYYAYSFSTNNLSLQSPGTYNYSDTGYAILGAVAQQVSEAAYHLNYAQFLQQFILSPMGITGPEAHPGRKTRMVGVGQTLESQKYPTEVTYYPTGASPERVSRPDRDLASL